MKRAIVPFLVVLFASATLAGSGEIAWETRPQQALERAAQTARPVVVDFWAVWCVPCQVMDETTYVDPRVIEALGRVVPLKVDADANEILVARYDIDAFPTLLVLDGEGREIARRRGLVEADALLEMIEAVLDGYGPYLEAVEARDDPDALEAVATYLASAGNPLGAVDALRRCLRELVGRGPARVEAVEVALAEQRLAAGHVRAAVKAFEELAESAMEPNVRSRALAGLVRAERERGREDRAAKWLEQLRRIDEERAESSRL